jgi:hypothetical protein
VFVASILTMVAFCADRRRAVAARTRGAERERMEQHVAALLARLRAEKEAAGGF